MGIFQDCAAHLTGLPIPGSYRANQQGRSDPPKPVTLRQVKATPKTEPLAEQPQKKSRRTVPTGNPTIDIPLWWLSPPPLNPFKTRPLYEDEI